MPPSGHEQGAFTPAFSPDDLEDQQSPVTHESSISPEGLKRYHDVYLRVFRELDNPDGDRTHLTDIAKAGIGSMRTIMARNEFNNTHDAAAYTAAYNKLRSAANRMGTFAMNVQGGTVPQKDGEPLIGQLTELPATASAADVMHAMGVVEDAFSTEFAGTYIVAPENAQNMQPRWSVQDVLNGAEDLAGGDPTNQLDVYKEVAQVAPSEPTVTQP